MKRSIICMMDILATKGVWLESGIDEYFKAVSMATSKIDEVKTQLDAASDTVDFQFDFISFSDTLILVLSKTTPPDETDEYFFHSYIPHFSQLALGVFQGFLAEGFLLRGAISYGLLAMQGNHIIGPAIEDVAEYHELQDMIGICLTPKATLAMDFAVDWHKKYNSPLPADQFVKKYATPLKHGGTPVLYQVDWVQHFIDVGLTNPNVSPINSFKSFLQSRNIPSGAISKIRNTLNFFESIGGNSTSQSL